MLRGFRYRIGGSVEAIRPCRRIACASVISPIRVKSPARQAATISVNVVSVLVIQATKYGEVLAVRRIASREETGLAAVSTVAITIARSGAGTGSANEVSSSAPACQRATFPITDRVAEPEPRRARRLSAGVSGSRS